MKTIYIIAQDSVLPVADGTVILEDGDKIIVHEAYNDGGWTLAKGGAESLGSFLKMNPGVIYNWARDNDINILMSMPYLRRSPRQIISAILNNNIDGLNTSALTFGFKEKASTATAKCPSCGGKYLVATGYCVSCEKKVVKKKKKEGRMVKKDGREAWEGSMEVDGVVYRYRNVTNPYNDPPNVKKVVLYNDKGKPFAQHTFSQEAYRQSLDRGIAFKTSGHTYKILDSVESGLNEEWGAGGFLSKDSLADYMDQGVDPDSIMMYVNMELLDLADSGKPIAKKLNKLSDFRVDSKEIRGKVAITYPVEIRRDKALQTFYKSIIQKVLKDNGIRESVSMKEGSDFVGSCVYKGQVCQIYDHGSTLTLTWDGGQGKETFTRREFDRLENNGIIHDVYLQFGKHRESIKIEAVDIKKIIKDLQGDFGGDNASQMKGVQLIKGLATSDDPLSNKFMKALNTAMTTISKEVLGE